ncbi:ROK family protein [Curtobacterium sp. MCPF17_052]|uniref:ROK family protein n=1 Tax=Curtobacterium sp. MCPF17_052 TaxID=2175655 RepID=UPI0024DF6812|nr:ROK family protein [Curtobacterium sp. MCPF17_052]WIB11588.1 ROK family protein [Curtobacterium sp. MCPF17_052]
MPPGTRGELGHTFVAANGIRCHCGAVGCLETEASQAALLDAARLGIDQADRLGDVLADGPRPELAAVVDRQVTALAVAIRNVVHTVNPDVVVLGGFLGTLLRHVGSRLEDAVRAQTMTAMGEDLRIVPAELVGSVLFRGAAELAFTSLLADPAAG